MNPPLTGKAHQTEQVFYDLRPMSGRPGSVLGTARGRRPGHVCDPEMPRLCYVCGCFSPCVSHGLSVGFCLWFSFLLPFDPRLRISGEQHVQSESTSPPSHRGTPDSGPAAKGLFMVSVTFLATWAQQDGQWAHTHAPFMVATETNDNDHVWRFSP